MKNLKTKRFTRSIISLIFIAIICSSCKHDEEMLPNYAGNWATYKSIAAAHGYVSVEYTLKLTGNSFTETFLTDVYRHSYPDPGKFVTIEGTISISGNNMSFIPSQISYSNYNLNTSIASKPYENYTDKDKNFNDIIAGQQLPTCNYKVEYTILNNQLVLLIDYNKDGQYSEYEKLVYAKQ